MKRHGLLGAILILSLLITTACGQQGPTEEETAALDYLQAVVTNDDDYLGEHVCAEVPPGTGSADLLGLWSVGLALKASGGQFSGEDVTVDVEAEREGEREDASHVRVRGTVSFPAELQPSEHMPLPIDDMLELNEVWRMVNEEGVWKWCGSATG